MSTGEVQQEIVAASARSYAHMFRQRVAATPEAVAYRYPAYTEPEEWRSMTWAEARTQVDLLAAGLCDLGVETGDRVAIVSGTRCEWVLIDLAIACAGAVTTTVYPNTKAPEQKFILIDAGCAVVVVENAEQLAKVTGDAELDARLHHIVLMLDDRTGGREDARVVTWEHLLRAGKERLEAEPDIVDAAIDTLDRESLSTLIYTSGTTGRPKGVELLHGSWTYEGEGIERTGIVLPDDSLFLWLPLAHVFGRDLLSAQLRVGFVCIVDGRVNRLVASIGETAPTILVGVPRIFEKVRAAVITMYPRQGLKGRMSRWAFAVGREAQARRLEGRRLPPGLALRHRLADRLVFSKLRQKLGGRMRFMVSGSAKLSAQVQEWFYSAGLMLIEGYGLTETSAIACVNHHDSFRPGTVGPALPGIEVRIDDDGEICFRGPIVARGYHKLPEATAESFVDGWFHTGDIGELDEDGYLRITDRKKDLLKTSNGKYVAPQKVESAIMANTPYAAQAVVLGEGRSYCTALLVLDVDQVASWASQHGMAGADYAVVTQSPELRRRIDHYIRRTNARLERWETIKKYVILDHELSQEADELTPSLKIKRSVVLDRYHGIIEALYADESPYEFVPDAPAGRRSRRGGAEIEELDIDDETEADEIEERVAA
ncbi:MAG: long-chain fatty acid--CoA ligase [Actinomycetia bacterium]|nr:long-chain fatty acid--CoA ligase [Actinomycetes bacterium]